MDLTERMLRLARRHGVEYAVCADAGALPFPDASFDCVFIGYGLRNFPDLDAALVEIARVTRPGGMLVSLDFFLPANPLLRGAVSRATSTRRARSGAWCSTAGRASTLTSRIRCESFVSIHDFSSLLHKPATRQVDARSYILGGIGLHWAAKAAANG